MALFTAEAHRSSSLADKIGAKTTTKCTNAPGHAGAGPLGLADRSAIKLLEFNDLMRADLTDCGHQVGRVWAIAATIDRRYCKGPTDAREGNPTLFGGSAGICSGTPFAVNVWVLRRTELAGRLSHVQSVPR